jgi:pimeloyl-ACP methyl ester carboxylesterase
MVPAGDRSSTEGPALHDRPMTRWIRVAVALVVVAAIVYFGAIGVEASHQLVNQHYRHPDCRTPAQYGLEYEAINYDGRADAELMEREPDPADCATRGAEAGDALVTSDGVALAGWYIPSAAPIGPSGPTVILSHGWTGSKSGQLPEAVLLHERFNVVLFDFRNHGQSEAAPTTQGIHEQRDLAAIIDWLVATKDPATIVLWGQSMGGHTSVNVAADDERVDGLVLDSTHAHLMTPMALRIEEDYPFGWGGAVATVIGAWIRSGVLVTSDEPIDAIGEIGARPVLILAAGSDATIPVDEARALLDAAVAGGAEARLEICEDSGHADLDAVCAADYGRWLNEFVAGVAEG